MSEKKKCKADINGHIIEADSSAELYKKIKEYEQKLEENNKTQYLKS